MGYPDSRAYDLGARRLGAIQGRSRQHANLVQSRTLFDASHPLVPIVTLAASVFVLLAPRIVSVALAIYLIVARLFGLNEIYHCFK